MGSPLPALQRGPPEASYLEVSGKASLPWCRKPRSFPGSSPACLKELSGNGKLSARRTNLQLLLSGRSGRGPPCLSTTVCSGMGLFRRLWDGSSAPQFTTLPSSTPLPLCCHLLLRNLTGFWPISQIPL